MEPLNQTSLRQGLMGDTYHLTEANVTGEDTDHVSTARNPDKGLVFLSLQPAFGVDLKKLRMKRSLKKTEGQFIDGYIDFRWFHYHVPKQKNIND